VGTGGQRRLSAEALEVPDDVSVSDSAASRESARPLSPDPTAGRRFVSSRSRTITPCDLAPCLRLAGLPWRARLVTGFSQRTQRSRAELVMSGWKRTLTIDRSRYPIDDLVKYFVIEFAANT
jgi:hypothetical protein